MPPCVALEQGVLFLPLSIVTAKFSLSPCLIAIYFLLSPLPTPPPPPSFLTIPSLTDPSQVTATSLEGVLVGHNYSGCAFVYGSLSFMDKLACGLALVIIEAVNGELCLCVWQGLLK